jgi:hypothetical protein
MDPQGILPEVAVAGEHVFEDPQGGSALAGDIVVARRSHVWWAPVSRPVGLTLKLRCPSRRPSSLR